MIDCRTFLLIEITSKDILMTLLVLFSMIDDNEGLALRVSDDIKESARKWYPILANYLNCFYYNPLQN